MSSPRRHPHTLAGRAGAFLLVVCAATVVAGCGGGGGSSGGSTSTVVVTASGTRSTTSTAHPGHATSTRGAPAREPATSAGAPASGSTGAPSSAPGGRLLRRYSGNGNALIGRIVVRSPAVLLWSASHPGIQIFTSNGFILVKSGASSGAIRLSAGTYRGVRVASPAAWSLQLRSRPG